MFYQPVSSLRCDVVSRTMTVFTACPARKRLVYLYPRNFTDHQRLHDYIVDTDDGINLLHDLEVCTIEGLSIERG